jgi:hypothetical protein
MPLDPRDEHRLEGALGRPPNGVERLVFRVIRPLLRPWLDRPASTPQAGPPAGAASMGIDLPTPPEVELRAWFCPSCGSRRPAGVTTCQVCGADATDPPRARPVPTAHQPSGVAATTATAGSATRGRRRPGRTRIAIVLGIVALSAVVAVVGLASGDTGPSLAAPVDPRLPDLVMAPIEDINPSFTGNLVHALRFGAKIANVGEGEFILQAKRSAPWSDDWRVYQRFREPDGRLSEQLTTAAIVFGNDHHDHWHVEAVEAHRLERKDTGEVLTEVVKQGFCFYDTDLYRAQLPGTPPEPIFKEAGCRGPLSATLNVGLSIGWADDYPWQMTDQRMAVGTIPDGVYRLHEIADPFDRFLETDETNNETWVDVELKTSGTFVEVRVIGRAPPD